MEIWKYPLPKSNNAISIPKDGKVLSCQVQNGIPHIWIMVDPYNLPEIRSFSLIGTGMSFEPKDTWEFINTVQINQYVFHIFELK